MSSKSTIFIDPQNATVAGRPSIFKMGTSQRYFDANVACTLVDGTAATEAEIKATIERIEVKINNRHVWDISATDYINCIVKANGFSINDGILPLFFLRAWLANNLNREDSALPMGGVHKFQIILHPAAAADTPTFRIWSQVDSGNDDKGNPIEIGNIVKLMKEDISVASTGKLKISDFEQEEGRYLAQHFVEASGDPISYISVSFCNSNNFS